MPLPRYVIYRKDGAGSAAAGSLYELPYHGQVCLHTTDAEIIRALESAGILVALRPPYLDAAEGGVHGAYASRPQVNLFFEPPIDAVARAITGPLGGSGYTVSEAAVPETG